MQNKIQRNTGRKGQRQHIASPFLIKLLYWRKWFILGHSIFSLPVGGQSCRQAVLLINAMLLLPLNQPKGSTSLRQVQQKRVSKLDGIETPSTTAGPLALTSWLTHINLQGSAPASRDRPKSSLPAATAQYKQQSSTLLVMTGFPNGKPSLKKVQLSERAMRTSLSSHEMLLGRNVIPTI